MLPRNTKVFLKTSLGWKTETALPLTVKVQTLETTSKKKHLLSKKFTI